MATRLARRPTRAPAAPPAPKPSDVDPTAAVAVTPDPTPVPTPASAPASTASTAAQERKPSPETCEVRPVHGLPIFVHRQKIMAVPNAWTLVRRDSWIDTQVAAKILEVR